MGDANMAKDLEVILASVTALATFLAWFVKVTIRSALSDFKDGITKEFGERFLSLETAKERLDNMQKDINYLRDKSNAIEEYTHKNNHEVRNKIQNLELKFGVVSAKLNINLPDLID